MKGGLFYSRNSLILVDFREGSGHFIFFLFVKVGFVDQVLDQPDWTAMVNIFLPI